jgi:hypothetical protein
MKKIILGLAVTAAIATPLAAPGSASAAGVDRCQETVKIETVSTTEATFTVNQPKDTVDQFVNVWKHVYTITVGPNGTFTGTGSVTANGVGDVVWTETITGQFLDNDNNGTSDHVTFNTTPNAGATFSVKNAPMDSTTVPVESNYVPNAIQFQIAQPVFATVDGVTEFANHGEYVTAMGGGKIAAQKCVGMPLVSKQGK